MQLKRKLVLTASRGGVVIFTSGDLRVDFTIEKSIGDALNTAKFVVYNLSPVIVKSLSDAKLGLADIKLEVGYAHSPELTILFEGELINMHNTPMFEDSLSTFWCWERGMREAQTKPTQPVSIPKSTVQAIMQNLADSILKDGKKLYGINFEGVTNKGTLSSVRRNFVPKKAPIEEIKNLAMSKGLLVTIKGNIIFITDGLNKIGDEERIAKAAKVTPFTLNPILLKKPIAFTTANVEVSYELTPKVFPLEILKVIHSAETQTDVSGISSTALSLVEGFKDIIPKDNYLILKVSHSGSLYTDTWNTNIKGVTYSNSVE